MYTHRKPKIVALLARAADQLDSTTAPRGGTRTAGQHQCSASQTQHSSGQGGRVRDSRVAAWPWGRRARALAAGSRVPAWAGRWRRGPAL